MEHPQNRVVKSAEHNALCIMSDELGAGGAPHEYSVLWNNDGYIGSNGIRFQNGPVKEVGFNGVTNEALVEIVLDRLTCFQAGEWKCRENALAITKLEEALHWLESRTKKRVERGVEGTSAK